ncbi:adenylosuccinate lyase [Streptomyces sp. CRN 30]|uniref:adenylosuccinate lyase n=1 Tax=Streptomyces sp. CRN 30 TaxID=3075613 RepID=UPI002A83854C|nr:adenylosuccinate lyase [Streptomyces sp. CRN 30]
MPHRPGPSGAGSPADVLAEEYASPALAALWSPHRQVVMERRLWLVVLRAQHAEGIRVPAGVFAAYEEAVDRVDLASIARRERVTRHDLKARIEEFNALAGHEHIHKGLTSCDITDNIAQARVRQSLEHLRARSVDLAQGPEPAGRGGAGQDRVPALRRAAERLSVLLGRYPLRGLKGAVGTAQDLLHLLDGDRAALARIERRVAAHLGFGRVLGSTGQVGPRSLDHEVLSTLAALVLPLGTDPPSAAPVAAVRRTRQCAVLVRGYAAMAAQLAGEQWNEGDVSCSVVRRVALPGAFFATDAALTAFTDGPGAGL